MEGLKCDFIESLRTVSWSRYYIYSSYLIDKEMGVQRDWEVLELGLENQGAELLS